MKKWWLWICCACLLTGCGAAETFETVGDDILQPVMAPAGQIVLELPDSASAHTMAEGKEDALYFCDGYTVTVQTMDRGDLDRTVRTLCGFGADSLKLVQTQVEGGRRWDWVWTAAGEGGDAVGRGAIIDDGKYHYCVTVMAQAEQAGKLETQWTDLLRSFRVD